MEAGHHDSVTYLRLWGGDLQGALQLAAEKGELNDHLLSIAPMGARGAFFSFASISNTPLMTQQCNASLFPFQPVSRRGDRRWRRSSSSCVCRSST